MKDDPTIFGDRETVELLAADPQLLAIADAVTATQHKEARAWRPRVRLLLAAAAVVALSAAGAWAVTSTSTPAHRTKTAAVVYRTRHLVPLTRRALKAAVLANSAEKALRYYPYYWNGMTLDDVYLPPTDRADYTITRTDGAVSSIAVALRGSRVGGTVRLQVHRARADMSRHGRVVFSERGSLSPFIETLAAADWLPLPARSVRTAGWTRTLSPSSWTGGCRNTRYWITVSVSPGPRRHTWSDVLVDPHGFTCRPAVARR